nr:hypothetical protein [Caldimonas sp.]
MAEPTARARGRPLWALALLAAVLPLAATAIAYPLSIRLELAPACNPFVDGCVSISRAGRHGLPNIVFRGLVLPAAVLQALCWMLCPAWLRSIGAPVDALQRSLPVLGVAAGAMLAVYATFLGTEGEGYRWMRRYGVFFYFGLTAIGALVVSDRMLRGLRGDAHTRRIALAVAAPCMLLPLLGLAHVLLPLWWPTPAQRNALENVTEWWGGAILTAFFVGLAWAWRKTRFRAELRSGDA